MDDIKALLAGKMGELDQNYSFYRAYLQCDEHAGAETSGELRKRLEQEFSHGMMRLETSAEKSKSAAVRELAEVQRSYFRKVTKLLTEKLPQDLHSEFSAKEDDVRDARALFAEYAIDYAEQAFRFALMAILQLAEDDPE